MATPTSVHGRSRINRKGRYKIVRVKLTDGGALDNRSGQGGSGGSKTISLGGAPGVIRGIAVDFTSVNASGVVVIKENNSSGATIFTINGGDTDTTNASTGEFLTPCTDGLTVTNTASTDVPGIFFAHGLYCSYASATAGDTVVIKLLIDTYIQYVKRTITCIGADGSAAAKASVYFNRPGRLVGIRVSASAGSTADATIKVDNDVNASAGTGAAGAGATVFTATNFGTTAIASGAGTLCPASLVSGGVDEAGGAVTTGYGIPFMHGFTLALAQCNAADTAMVAEFWVEV